MLLLALHICLVTAFSIRILLRDDLEANSRLAWFVVLLLFPYFGTVIYWLFGENNISKRGTEKYRAVFAKMRNDYPDSSVQYNKTSNKTSNLLNYLIAPLLLTPLRLTVFIPSLAIVRN